MDWSKNTAQRALKGGGIWGFEVACAAAPAGAPRAPATTVFRSCIFTVLFKQYLCSEVISNVQIKSQGPVEPLPDCAHVTAAGTAGPLWIVLPALPWSFLLGS